MRKLFSELASCLSGATVTPTAEPTEPQRQSEVEQHSRRHARRTTKTTPKVSGAAAHWKPKLNAISENTPISEAATCRRRTGIDDKKRQAKPKYKPPTKAAPPPNLAEDYWRYSQTLAVPAFAPTSYLF